MATEGEGEPAGLPFESCEGETCSEPGQWLCQGGSARLCATDPGSGCIFLGEAALCDDDNLCDGQETCTAALGCSPGEPPSCDDDNLCDGQETCDPLTGCAPGTPLDCDDADACLGDGACEVLDCPLGSVDGDALAQDGCEVELDAIYVDAAAPSGGDGSEEAPFQTIPEAHSLALTLASGGGAAADGLIVHVAAGTYDGPSNSGTRTTASSRIYSSTTSTGAMAAMAS